MIWSLNRGVIKTGKAAALPKFSDTLILTLPRGADNGHLLALPHLNFYQDYAPDFMLCIR